jgi:hypothetical protein
MQRLFFYFCTIFNQSYKFFILNKMNHSQLNELLNAVIEGKHNPINPNLSLDNEKFFCDNYKTFIAMLEIIKLASSNKIVHLIITIFESIVKGIAAGICPQS